MRFSGFQRSYVGFAVTTNTPSALKKLMIISLLLSVVSVLGQTELRGGKTNGPVKVWSMLSSKNDTLGKVYSLERGQLELLFSPKPGDLHSSNAVVFTGTYTSPDGRVAGSAIDRNCKEIGNTNDALFKPNAHLVFQNGTVQFSETATCNTISVYKLIDGTVLSSIVNGRTKKSMLWRFFVEKSWSKTYIEGDSQESGKDILIVDFEKPMTLTEACDHVRGLQRTATYHDGVKNKMFNYASSITAALLDTGTYRPFLLSGQSVHGPFPTQQSNVIIVR